MNKYYLISLSIRSFKMSEKENHIRFLGSKTYKLFNELERDNLYNAYGREKYIEIQFINHEKLIEEVEKIYMMKEII